MKNKIESSEIMNYSKLEATQLLCDLSNLQKDMLLTQSGMPKVHDFCSNMSSKKVGTLKMNLHSSLKNRVEHFPAEVREIASKYSNQTSVFAHNLERITSLVPARKLRTEK